MQAKRDDDWGIDRADFKNLVYIAQQFQELNLLKLHLHLEYGINFHYNKRQCHVTLPLLVCLRQTDVLNDPFEWMNERETKDNG